MGRAAPRLLPTLLATFIPAYPGMTVAQEVRAFAFTGVVTAVDRAAPAAPGVVRLTDTAEPGAALGGWFAYPAMTADADPRPGRGRYELQTALGASFRLETVDGEAGLGTADLARATVRVMDDGPRGDVFKMTFDDSWGAIAFTVELVDALGGALAGDALPAKLEVERFGMARLDFHDLDRFAGTRAGFTGCLATLTGPQ